MTITRQARAAAPAETAGALDKSGTSRARLLDLARTVRQGYLQVLGVPDYERYRAHMASQHPGEPVRSRRDFYAWSIDRKYRCSGPRCC